ncbi:MAG: hypothetical protein R2814_02795 [Flavobacteriaceae bacterium]
MKNTAIFQVAATTLVLFSLTIMAAMDFPFHWIFYITVIGQIMLISMVFKVLRDKYTTDKTFKEFYEDYPLRDEFN